MKVIIRNQARAQASTCLVKKSMAYLEYLKPVRKIICMFGVCKSGPLACEQLQAFSSAHGPHRCRVSKNVQNSHKSRLTVVSRAAKQSRTSDTTVCYIHERSILIERALKACYKKLPYEKTTRVTRTTSYH